MKTTILKNEFWYGGAVYEGYRQPVGADDIVDWDFRENPTHNPDHAFIPFLERPLYLERCRFSHFFQKW